MRPISFSIANPASNKLCAAPTHLRGRRVFRTTDGLTDRLSRHSNALPGAAIVCDPSISAVQARAELAISFFLVDGGELVAALSIPLSATGQRGTTSRQSG